VPAAPLLQLLATRQHLLASKASAATLHLLAFINWPPRPKQRSAEAEIGRQIELCLDLGSWQVIMSSKEDPMHDRMLLPRSRGREGADQVHADRSARPAKPLLAEGPSLADVGAAARVSAGAGQLTGGGRFVQAAGGQARRQVRLPTDGGRKAGPGLERAVTRRRGPASCCLPGALDRGTCGTALGRLWALGGAEGLIRQLVALVMDNAMWCAVMQGRQQCSDSLRQLIV
jgi:hypothetical protein